MNLLQNPNVNNYLSKVCEQIKWQEVHASIKAELVGHLEDQIYEFTSKGMPTEIAITEAIKQMGDPVSLGIQLHQTHKPRIDWKLIFFTILFAGFGLFTLYTIQANEILTHGHSFFYKTIFYTIMGAIILVLVSISDYRKFQKMSGFLYAATIGIWILALLFGNSSNGLPFLVMGPFSINIAAISPYLLTLALAGLLVNCRWKESKSVIIIATLFLIPVFLYLVSSCFSGLLLFTSALIILLYLSRAKLYQIMLILAITIVPTLLGIILVPYRLERLVTYFNPQGDLTGAGYLYIQISEAIKNAGFFGQGFNLSALPELHTDFVFTYITYSLGWIAGLILILITLIFFAHLFKTFKKTKNDYGSLLIAGLATLLLVQTFWHILMNLGCLPIMEMSLPFISYGGSQLIVQMMVLGVILSVYRLKDIELFSNNLH